VSGIRFIAPFFKKVTWYFVPSGKEIYITFDDGPTENTTGWILDKLNEYEAKATFFCLGEKAARFKKQYERILEEGHSVGNHTHTHLSGWTTQNNDYFIDIEKARQWIHSNLFRPPYGRIRPSQVRYLRKKYKIIMWDVMSRDYDKRQKPDRIIRHIIKHVRPGSIVVLHDSEKASEKMKLVLSEFLEYYDQKGYSFRSIPFETTGHRTVKE